MGAPRWAGRYVGLRFVDGGRDFRGVDCEGLNRLVFKHEAGDPPLPAWGIVSADGLHAVAKAIEANAVLRPWVKVDRPKAFDWVLMTGRDRVDGRSRELLCHLGIMVSETTVLHIEVQTDSVAVSRSHPSIRHRVRGFLRHEALA